MSIPVYPFKEATKLNPNNPFPEHISKDPDVLYHGTSSINETSIEHVGINVNSTIFTKEEIEDILTLFDSVKWPVKKFWSESNLRNYSINHDFANPDLKPIYFGECAERVSLYASKEFAGGEIARSVRQAFMELKNLISNPIELEKELLNIENAKPFTSKTVEDYDLSLNELQNLLDKKKAYLEKANKSLIDYEYGVIYAIKFRYEDEQHLEYSLRGGMGIKCFKSIPASRIVAKTIIPKDYVHNHNHFVKYMELPCRRKDGILYRIKNDRGISMESLNKKTEEILARVRGENG